MPNNGADNENSDCCYSDCDNDAVYYDSDNTGYCTSHQPNEKEDEDGDN